MGIFGGSDWRLAFVWAKAMPIAGVDPNVARMDAFGNVMRRADYGDRTSEYGWEIDHTRPVALGGSDDLSNLRPLHWRANAKLGAGLASLLKR